MTTLDRPRTSPADMLYRLYRLGLMSLLGVVAAFAASAAAQIVPAQRESTVKAAFLHKFIGFTEWPPAVFKSPDQPFVIGMLGAEEVASDLEKLVAGRTVEGRPIAVKRLRELHSDAGIHLLFVGQQRDGRLRDALQSAAGPMLVVTEQDGALAQGSVINFSTDAGRVRFSVSLAAAEARNLKLSARLLAVAQLVEGRSR